MKLITIFAATIIMHFIPGTLSGQGKKLHWYYDRASFTEERNKTFLTFSDALFTYSTTKLQCVQDDGPNEGLKRFYIGIDFFRFIDKLKNNELKTAMVNHLKQFDQGCGGKEGLKTTVEGLFGNGSADAIYITKPKKAFPLSRGSKLDNDYSDLYLGFNSSLTLNTIDRAEYTSLRMLAGEGQQALLSKLVEGLPKLDLAGKKEINPALTNFMENVFQDVEVKHVSNYDSDCSDYRLVLSTANLSSLKSDRIEKVTYKIYSPDVTFSNWSDVSLSWSSIDLGNESYESNFSAGLDTAGVSLGLQTKRGQDIKYSRRYVSLAGGLNNNTIQLFQEGVPGVDLTGSISFDICIRRNDNNKLKKCGDELIILFGTYTLRHVTNTKGRRTVGEGDDNVQSITISTVKPYLLSHLISPQSE